MQRPVVLRELPGMVRGRVEVQQHRPPAGRLTPHERRRCPWPARERSRPTGAARPFGACYYPPKLLLPDLLLPDPNMHDAAISAEI